MVLYYLKRIIDSITFFSFKFKTLHPFVINDFTEEEKVRIEKTRQKILSICKDIPTPFIPLEQFCRESFGDRIPESLEECCELWEYYYTMAFLSEKKIGIEFLQP